MPDSGPSAREPTDETGARLSALEAQLRGELVGIATIEKRPVSDCITSVAIRPDRNTALAVSWLIVGDVEVVLEAGHKGGRWELEYTARDVDFLEDVTRSVIAGRAVETFAWRRSRVDITLDRGEVTHETGGEGVLAMLSLPGWRRWGRRIRYDAYR